MTKNPPPLPIMGNRLIIPASEPFPFSLSLLLPFLSTISQDGESVYWYIIQSMRNFFKLGVYYYREGLEKRTGGWKELEFVSRVNKLRYKFFE